jgi:hypothetical protein
MSTEKYSGEIYHQQTYKYMKCCLLVYNHKRGFDANCGDIFDNIILEQKDNGKQS